MDREDLKRIVLDQNQLVVKDDIIEREVGRKVFLQSETPFIVILIGLRRSGKSTILNLLRKRLRHKFNYLNFDDYRLVKFSADDFEKLEEVFLELYGRKDVFYFDEIQNVDNWERFVRTLHDNGKKVFLTGSNASMLSSELGTHLTGRNIPISVFPFSFSEYLKIRGIKYSKRSFYLKEKRAKLIFEFNNYLLKGGIPDYVKTSRDDFFKTIFEDIIFRDVASRYSITNTKSLKELVYYLMTNIGKEFSFNKVKDLVGVKNVTTIKEYIEYFENSFLLFTISKFDYSLKKQIVNPKKVYCIDNGLRNSVSFNFSEDKGRLLENLVFVELKRRGFEVYYHRDRGECDFVIKKGLDIVYAIQVSYDISDEDTKEREFNGLLDAMETYSLKEGVILTSDFEGEENIDEKKIVIKPVWKWLLSERNF